MPTILFLSLLSCALKASLDACEPACLRGSVAINRGCLEAG
jgi:hypothetical protein